MRVCMLGLGLLFFALICAGPLTAGTEIMEIVPLEDDDLYHFKQEGAKGWKLDKKSDDIHTLIVHEKAREDSALVFVRRKFKQGFRLSMQVMGGSKYKGLECLIVPPEGERILVPINKRWLSKSGWLDYVVTVEKGKVWAKVGEERTEKIEVPRTQELSFALRLAKRSEAMIRNMKIKFLVVSEEQMKPEPNFVRIFDGKSAEGWNTVPEDAKGAFKVGDQKIEGKFKQGPRHYAQFMYGDALFADYVLRFKASSDTRGLHLLVQSNDIPAIDDYFQRDKDWNEVEWEVKNWKVTLKINGRVALTKTQSQEVQANPMFLLQPGGKCTLRDIRVGGRPLRAGGTWQKYASASGVAGGGSPAGGNTNTAGASRGAAERVLFNGKDFTDWRTQPAGDAVWSVDEGRIIGLTLDRQSGGRCLYQALVFFDYRLKFKIQRGTSGAKFIAREVPKQVADRPTIGIDIKADWIDGEAEWTEFEATALDGKLTIKAKGKVVHNGTVHKEQGHIGFVLAPNSAIGVKDIVWQRPN